MFASTSVCPYVLEQFLFDLGSGVLHALVWKPFDISINRYNSGGPVGLPPHRYYDFCMTGQCSPPVDPGTWIGPRKSKNELLSSIGLSLCYVVCKWIHSVTFPYSIMYNINMSGDSKCIYICTYVFTLIEHKIIYYLFVFLSYQIPIVIPSNNP